MKNCWRKTISAGKELIDIFLFYLWTNVRHKARKTIMRGWMQIGPQSPGWAVQRLIHANPWLGTVWKTSWSVLLNVGLPRVFKPDNTGLQVFGMASKSLI